MMTSQTFVPDIRQIDDLTDEITSGAAAAQLVGGMVRVVIYRKEIVLDGGAPANIATHSFLIAPEDLLISCRGLTEFILSLARVKVQGAVAALSCLASRLPH